MQKICTRTTMNVRQATHFRCSFSFSHMGSLHVHTREVHWGLTSNLVCSFGLSLMPALLKGHLKVLKALSIMRVAEKELQQQNWEKQRQEGKGCRCMKQDCSGKRATCSLLDAPKTTAEDTFCTRALKNPQHDKASIEQKGSTKPSFKESTKHQSSSIWHQTTLLSSSSSITSSFYHHSSLTLSTLK